MSNYHGTPKHPIREVLRRLMGRAAPDYVQGYDLKNLTDNQYLELQGWASGPAGDNPIHWSTGIGTLEAAVHIVEEAVANGNIPPKDGEQNGTSISRVQSQAHRRGKKARRRAGGVVSPHRKSRA